MAELFEESWDFIDSRDSRDAGTAETAGTAGITGITGTTEDIYKPLFRCCLCGLFCLCGLKKNFPKHHNRISWEKS